MKEEISVLLSADDNYARYCGITILSVLENSIAPSRFHFYILSPDFSDRNKNQIQQLCNQFEAQASIIPIDLNLFASLPSIQKHFNLNNYSRLYGPSLCESCQKMVYLDCDLIIKGDIAELFEYNLKGKPIGAVPHVQLPYEKEFREEFHVNDQDTYFNSGVMLIDAVQWRENKWGEAVLGVALESPHKLHFADQDALNAVFWENYYHLPGVWNVEARLYREKLLGLPQTPEITKRMANPKIIHYTGADKPWSSKEYVPCRSLYTYYSHQLAELTGWQPRRSEPKQASITSYLRFAYSCLYFRGSKLKNGSFASS